MNPLWIILNGSYDIIQHENRSRSVFTLAYGAGTRNVLRNLGSPLGTISRYGWGKFLRTEVFPLSFSLEGGQWWPNYTLHLVGGGMTYRATEEWFTAHGFGEAWAWSLGTMATYHLLNEIVENGRHDGPNADPLADLYLFDAAGILLFGNEDVARFFSRTLHLTDWSLQPTFALNNGTLQNNGQYFAMKWKLPWSEDLYLFHYVGLRGLFGLTRRFADGDAVSVAGGVRAVRLRVLDPELFLLTAVLRWEAGVFYDRNNSLLASLLVGGSPDNPVTLNVYPGVLRIDGFSPGFWILVSEEFGVSAGITTVWTPGVGLTARRGDPGGTRF